MEITLNKSAFIIFVVALVLTVSPFRDEDDIVIDHPHMRLMSLHLSAFVINIIGLCSLFQRDPDLTPHRHRHFSHVHVPAQCAGG